MNGDSYTPKGIQTGKNRNDGKQSSQICEYCKKAGHSNAKCYKLHGFPSNFKSSFKRKKMPAQVQANNIDSASFTHVLELTED